VGTLTAGACITVGGAIGFLFGIPRVRRLDSKSDDAKKNEETLNQYEQNANLEQISDWLTKILVGVGLTQIGKIKGNFVEITTFLSQGFTENQATTALFGALVIYYATIGFFLGFLWARLFLKSEFIKADRRDLTDSVSKLESFHQQYNKNTEARNLVDQQLSSDPEAERPSVEKLTEAIKQASHQTVVKIFNHTSNIRAGNIDRNKDLMERTIPLFKALIAKDDAERYHKNYGQLGFALMDKVDPDWVAAQEALTKAIQIRNAQNEQGWKQYEFFRAICKIKLDEGFMKKKASTNKAKEGILSDLRIVSESAAKELVLENDTIQYETLKTWLEINNLSTHSLSFDSNET